jgi:hypothetical protein
MAVSVVDYMTLTEHIKRAWNSPTLMTWGAMSSKSLSLVLLTPLVLAQFEVADIVVWYLFSSLVALQMMLDLGFNPTFARIVAYGKGGVKIEELFTLRKKSIYNKAKSNQETIYYANRMMGKVYASLAVLSLTIGISLGSYSMESSISRSTDPDTSWAAWGVVLITTSFILYGNRYKAFLLGINLVAELHRLQMITSLLAIICSSIVLIYGANILILMVMYQFWFVVGILLLRRLALQSGLSSSPKFIKSQKQRLIWLFTWPAAWRSGIGIMMTAGLIHFSGVLYANLEQGVEVVTYLLGLQVIRAISGFSTAPFYSKIPRMVVLYAKHETRDLLKVAQRGMRLSYVVFLAGFLLAGISANWLLDTINSKSHFPSDLIWGLLGLAVFLERYGAMHIQLYSTSNHIVWHIANGVSGIIMIAVAVALYPSMDVVSFPIAMVVGYLFYVWYSFGYSKKEYDLKFTKFERRAFIPSFAVLIMIIGGLYFV